MKAYVEPMKIFLTAITILTASFAASALEQGELELRINGKTVIVSGLMATIETKNGKSMLYLGATDPEARTKVNISLVLPGEFKNRRNFSSLNHEMMFTLKSPESAMLIMPQAQPVRTSLEMIETDSDDPEGYGAAVASRRTKPRHDLSAEELHHDEERVRRQRGRSFRKKEAEWAKMDTATRIKTGKGIMENPGQRDTAVFLTVEPVLVGDTIVELKGTVSGFAPGKQNKRWLMETSEFRAVFINRPEGR